MKNGDERLVVLNSTVKAIISKLRGIYPEWVFPYNDAAMYRMNDSMWCIARTRAADVPEEDRRVLLGHTNGSVTSHYSGAELGKLVEYMQIGLLLTISRHPC